MANEIADILREWRMVAADLDVEGAEAAFRSRLVEEGRFGDAAAADNALRAYRGRQQGGEHAQRAPLCCPASQVPRLQPPAKPRQRRRRRDHLRRQLACWHC